MSVKQPGRRGRDRTGAAGSADPGIDVVRRGAAEAASQSMDETQQHAVAIAVDAKARLNLRSIRKRRRRGRGRMEDEGSANRRLHT